MGNSGVKYPHRYLREDAQQENLEGVISKRGEQSRRDRFYFESQRYREEYSREIEQEVGCIGNNREGDKKSQQ